MDDVVSTFPLLCLPIHAILETLKTMEHPQVIAISLLSKKTKNLVECLKVTTEVLEILVTSNFGIHLFFPNKFRIEIGLYAVSENEPLQELDTPENWNIYYGKYENYFSEKKVSNVVWTNSMSVKELLDHLQFIFHSSITLLYFGPGSECFNLESIHRTVKKVESIRIWQHNQEHGRRILSLFQADTLEIVDSDFIDGRVPREVLIQNFDHICVGGEQIILEELLVNNARGIDTYCHRLSEKTFNQFLKLWGKGSNLRMEWLRLSFHGNIEVERLFSGMNHKIAPPHRVRLFKTTGCKKSLKVTGGWDFRRFDGTHATITFRQYDIQMTDLRMYVWHDHCVGN